MLEWLFRANGPCPSQSSKVEQARTVNIMGQRIVKKPWTVATVDVMGPFSRSTSAFKYILVFKDLLIKWLEVLLIGRANGLKNKKAFKGFIVSRWGTPELGIIHTTNPVHQTQVNPAKHVSPLLKTIIVSFLHENPKEWGLHLPKLRCSG